MIDVLVRSVARAAAAGAAAGGDGPGRPARLKQSPLPAVRGEGENIDARDACYRRACRRAFPRAPLRRYGYSRRAPTLLRAHCAARNDVSCPPSCGLAADDDAPQAPAELDPDLTRIRELVRRHQVCWEVYPKTLSVAHGLRQVGYELELFGTRGKPKVPIVPGREEYRAIYQDLLEIARWIAPREARPARLEIEPYEVALNFSPKRKFRDDVRLAIDIVHREGFDRPIDECEVRCLRDMKRKLKEAGARPEQW